MATENKTAVEWLIHQLTGVERNLINKTYLRTDNTLAGKMLLDLFEQAKELEKQQTISGYYDGYKNGQADWGDGSDKTGEDYYAETYGGNNHDTNNKKNVH